MSTVYIVTCKQYSWFVVAFDNKKAAADFKAFVETRHFDSVFSIQEIPIWSSAEDPKLVYP